MMNSIKQIFAPPQLADENTNRLAEILNFLLWAVFLILLGYLGVKLFGAETIDPVPLSLQRLDLLFTGLWLFILSILLGLMRRGYVYLAGRLLILTSWVNLTVQALMFGGVYDSAFTAYFILILGAGLLLGRWFGIGMAILCSLSGGGLAYAQSHNLILSTIDGVYVVWIDQTINFILAALVIFRAVKTTDEALTEAHQNEQFLAEANRELEEVRRSLEARVLERTAELEAKTIALEIQARELAYAKETAEAANQTKTKFLATMSHELRTPLNGVLGYAQILLRRHDFTPEVMENIRTIHTSGQHLLTLIDDILAVSKLETQRLELKPTPFALTPFFQEIIHLVGKLAQEKPLTFQVDLPKLPFIVSLDGVRLKQVLLNLLTNAIKFTPQGEIIFRVKLYPSATPDLIRLHVAVVDTGIGIEATDLSRIFEPFERVNVVKWSEGAGIGLSVSQEIIRLMGGEIKVQSVWGQGSCFDFELSCPVVAPDMTSYETFSSPEPFVIDDHEIIVPALEELEELRQLAQSGRMSQILKWVAKMEAQNKTYKPFLQRIEILAKQFDDQAILSLLTEYNHNR